MMTALAEAVKPSGRTGCLTVLGIVSGDVVVGLARVERRADVAFEVRDVISGGAREGIADLLADPREARQGRGGVAHHRRDSERPRRLVEGPERFGTIRIGLGERGEGRGRGRGGTEPVVKGAEQRERVEAGAEVRRDAGPSHQTARARRNWSVCAHWPLSNSARNARTCWAPRTDQTGSGE